MLKFFSRFPIFPEHKKRLCVLLYMLLAATVGWQGTSNFNNFAASTGGNNIFTGTNTFANVNKIVFGIGNGMKCDGSTDDTAAAQATLDSGGKNALVVWPPTLTNCQMNGNLIAYDGSTIIGAGKFSTTLKRKNSANVTQPVFLVAAGGQYGTVGNVTFSDFTIDGNSANQTTGQDLIYAATTVSKFTVQRMRLINSWFHAIELLSTTQNTDILIADNDFESNGIVSGSCPGVAQCEDIRIQHPLRVRVSRNRSDSSQNFLVTVPSGTDGQMVIEENVVSNCLGFAVALGGVQVGSAITRNTFSCPASTQNIIDIANATDTVVNSNILTMGTANNGLSDLPPALRVSVVGNVIIGNTAGAGTSSCITLGGNDTTITGNLCRDAGGAGIILAVANTGPSKAAVIADNVVKNCSRASSGTHAGIELFVQTGGTGALSEVIIHDNRAYDDASTTQGWGIGLAVSGQVTGFSGITVHDNDVRGNKTAGINDNINPLTNVQIYNNPGGEAAVVGGPTLAATTLATPNSGQQDIFTIKAGGNTAADVGTILYTTQGGTALSRMGVGGDGVFQWAALTSVNICPGQSGLGCPASGTPAFKFLPGGLIAGGTAAGLTGTGACATITTQTGGSWAGRATCTGTTGASTFIITPGSTAPNGWVCEAFDQTTRANLLQQTSTSGTACTLTATSITLGDVIVFSAKGF
jgi:hypothetical protein